MNQQIVLFGLVFLTVTVMFLFYQNIKLERKYNREMGQITSNMKEMTNMIALHGDISQKVSNLPSVAPHEEQEQELVQENLNLNVETYDEPEIIPEVSDELINDITEEYSNYKVDEKYDSISEDLKREIENLEKRESSSNEEELDTRVEEPHMKEELENTLDNEIDNELNTELNTELDNTLDNINLDELQNEEVDLDSNVQEFETLEESSTLLETKLNTSEYSNLVDDVIATASEAEQTNLDLDSNDKKSSWDGSTENTEEGLFVVLNDERKNIEELSVKELTYLCKMSGLKSRGKKVELLNRFKDYSTAKKNTFFLENN